MTVTAVIVQARMASTRLPGKILLQLGGHTVLWHTLTRCAAIDGIDLVCCAVPDTSENDPVAEEAARSGAIVTRGSEYDVLGRYLNAANEIGADIAMRVTSDCPVIDPNVCTSVLKARANAKADYACNNMPRRWPLGLDCEAFTISALKRAANLALKYSDREHVTPWLRRDDSIRRSQVAGPDLTLSNHRWTIDFLEDYHFFQALAGYLPALHSASFEEILATVRAHPDLSALNAHC